MHRLRWMTVLTWMSGVLCTLAVIFWIRGFWTVDALDLVTAYHATSVINADGGLHVQRLLFDYLQPDWMAQQELRTPQTAPSCRCDYHCLDAYNTADYVGATANMGGRWGFWFVNGWHAPRWNMMSPPYPDDGWTLRIPWWSFFLVTAILPAMGLNVWVSRERPRRRGICPQCGYDLRATPRRCPECGYVPPAGGTPLNL